MRSAKWALQKWVVCGLERKRTQQGLSQSRKAHASSQNYPKSALCGFLLWPQALRSKEFWGQRDAEVQGHDGHFPRDLGIYLWKETQKQASSSQVWLPSHLPPISMYPLLTGGKWVVQNKDPQRCHGLFKLHGKGELRHQVGLNWF